MDSIDSTLCRDRSINIRSSFKIEKSISIGEELILYIYLFCFLIKKCLHLILSSNTHFLKLKLQQLIQIYCRFHLLCAEILFIFLSILFILAPSVLEELCVKILLKSDNRQKKLSIAKIHEDFYTGAYGHLFQKFYYRIQWEIFLIVHRFQ